MSFLGSLFLQYFLFAAALLRKRRIHHWFRSLIWLAYQAGDVVAIYALATLFIHHKIDSYDYHGRAYLYTLWAPILLLHLGGQDGITAYSIEDNENWRRHFLVAVSQITIAIYVYRKTTQKLDASQLQVAILLFIPGVFKCLEKPWALKNATVASIMNSSDSRLEATLDLDDDVAMKNIVSLDDYVKQARDHFVNHPLEVIDDGMADEPYHLFVDLGHPYAIRLKNLQLMAPPRRRGPAAGEQQLSFYREVHDLLRSSLSRAFDRLYTKHKHLASYGGLLRAAFVLAAILDITILLKLKKLEYYNLDAPMTYVLLAGTAALELISACVVLGSGLPWPDDRVSQYNLIGYLARNKKHHWMRRFALTAEYMDHLDTLWGTGPPEPTLRITKLVHDHVAGGWNDGMDTVEAYRRFNDGRGQRTLEKEKCGGQALAASLRMPFDESVLVWHLATEFCYFDHVDADVDATRHGRVVSNYMAYLLAVKPEMLVPGARPGLFRAAYEELRKMLNEKPLTEDDVGVEKTEKKPMSSPPMANMDEMARKIIQRVKSAMGSRKVVKKTTSIVNMEHLVHKAWEVACELMEFAKAEEVNENRRLVEEENRKAEEVEMEKLMEAGKKKVQEEKRKAEVEKAKLTNEEKNKLKEEVGKEKLIEAGKKKVEEEKRKAEAEKAKLTDEEKKKLEEEVGKEKLIEAWKKKVEEEKSKAEAEKAKLTDEERKKLEEEEEERRFMEEERKKKERMNRAKKYGDERMWAVIRGVWVEMLCFSAGRCRGYLHARSLANGGEYLSNVWLLLSYMGMETMPERMQRLEIPVGGDTGAALVKAPMEEVEMTEAVMSAVAPVVGDYIV